MKTTKEDRIKILSLHKEGKAPKEIAQTLGWNTTEQKDAIQKVLDNYRVKMRKEQDEKDKKMFDEITLDQMSREQRLDYLRRTIDKTPRAKIIFAAFSGQEKDFFIDEYFKIVKSTDSLSEPEEQSLFSACTEFVLAYRAMSLKTEEEKCYSETLLGMWKPGDPRFRLKVDEKFQQEYDSHLNNYQKFIKDLKMSRAQRLDKIKNDKHTLVELATELSNKSIQSEAADRIIKLSEETDEELKRMLDSGYLLGEFSG